MRSLGGMDEIAAALLPIAAGWVRPRMRSWVRKRKRPVMARKRSAWPRLGMRWGASSGASLGVLSMGGWRMASPSGSIGRTTGASDWLRVSGDAGGRKNVVVFRSSPESQDWDGGFSWAAVAGVGVRSLMLFSCVGSVLRMVLFSLRILWLKTLCLLWTSLRVLA